MKNLIFIIGSVLLNCSAQLLMRKGMLVYGEVDGFHSLIGFIPQMLSNLYLWGAMLCYAVSIMMWMFVLSRVEVSYAYPFLSIGYVLSAVVGYFWLQENITPIRIVGIAVICIGVVLISRS